jgi:hypothetical protein
MNCPMAYPAVSTVAIKPTIVLLRENSSFMKGIVTL